MQPGPFRRLHAEQLVHRHPTRSFRVRKAKGHITNRIGLGDLTTETQEEISTRWTLKPLVSDETGQNFLLIVLLTTTQLADQRTAGGSAIGHSDGLGGYAQALEAGFRMSENFRFLPDNC